MASRLTPLPAAFLGWALLGCHSVDALVPPPMADARGAILIASNTETDSVFASTIDEDGVYTPSPRFDIAGDFELTGLGYGCDVEALGLLPGRQLLNEDPAAQVELPVPRAAVRRRVGESGTAWEPISASATEVDPQLQRLDLDAGNLCRIFRRELGAKNVVEVRLGSGQSVGFATELDASRLFFTLTDGRHFMLPKDGAPEEILALDGVPAFGGFRAADGEIWLVGRNGRIARGHPDTGFEVIDVQTATSAEERLRVVGPSTTDVPFELFALDARGHLSRFDGTKWTELAVGEFHRRLFDRPSIAWVGPEQAFAVGASQSPTSILSYDRGRLTQLELPEEAGIAVGVGFVPGIGVVVGAEGASFVLDEGQWAPIPTASDEAPPAGIRFVWPLDTGFGFAAFSSRLVFGEFHKGAGAACPILLEENNEVDWVLPLGDEVYLFEAAWMPGGKRIRTTRYETQKRPLDCANASIVE